MSAKYCTLSSVPFLTRRLPFLPRESNAATLVASYARMHSTADLCFPAGRADPAFDTRLLRRPGRTTADSCLLVFRAGRAGCAGRAGRRVDMGLDARLLCFLVIFCFGSLLLCFYKKQLFVHERFCSGLSFGTSSHTYMTSITPPSRRLVFFYVATTN